MSKRPAPQSAMKAINSPVGPLATRSTGLSQAIVAYFAASPAIQGVCFMLGLYPHSHLAPLSFTVAGGAPPYHKGSLCHLRCFLTLLEGHSLPLASPSLGHSCCAAACSVGFEAIPCTSHNLSPQHGAVLLTLSVCSSRGDLTDILSCVWVPCSCSWPLGEVRQRERENKRKEKGFGWLEEKRTVRGNVCSRKGKH